MSKIFMSHSSKDIELVKSFVKLLQLGLGIAREDIFCSSLKGSLPSGENFIKVIKDNLCETKTTIFILTESFLKSQFCLAELGAVWALGQKIHPLVVTPITYKDLRDTPLLASQCLRLTDENDLRQLFTELINENLGTLNLAELDYQINDFFSLSGFSNTTITSKRTIEISDKQKQYLDYLEKQSENDDEACFSLGMIYWEGVLVSQDSQKAERLLLKASANGYSPAMYELSSLYYQGDSGEQDFKKAFYWASKIDSKKYPHLVGKLGFLYQTGLGCDADLDLALKCYIIAADAGEKRWYSNIAEIYAIKGDYVKASEFYKMAVESGYKLAALQLGMIYKEGRKDIPIDYVQAAFYFEIAAHEGITDAKYQMGQLYYMGYAHFGRDFKVAFEWFEEAADEGDTRSQYNLAYCYQHGLGVERNIDLALYWFEKAANRGHQLSQVNSGDIFSRIERKEYQKAIEQYSKAALQNYAEAYRKIGDIFLFGLSGEKDQSRALTHYKLAIDQHDELAQLRMKDGEKLKDQ